MSDVLDRVHAQMEHFKATVCPEADVFTISETLSRLSVTMGSFRIRMRVYDNPDGLRVVVSTLSPPFTQSEALARAGGMLVQLSNLMTQIQALAPEVTSDPTEQPEAVG